MSILVRCLFQCVFVKNTLEEATYYHSFCFKIDTDKGLQRFCNLELAKACFIFDVSPRMDSCNVPILNQLLFNGLQSNFVGHAKKIKLTHVDKKDRVHLNKSGYHVLSVVINNLYDDTYNSEE